MSTIAKPPAPDLGEFAASGDATNFAATFADELAIPRDAILKGQAGGDYDVYQRMKRDDQIAACWQQRVRAAIKCEWFVEPGGNKTFDKKAADFIREELAAIRFDRVCEKMLNAAYYGYSVAECLWRADGGLIRFEGIKTRNLRRFKFRRDGLPVLITRDAPKGRTLPERKFWVLSMGGDDDDDDPYGLGLAHHLYWPVWLKRNAIKFWAVWLEKYAIPAVWANAPSGSSGQQVDELLATLVRLNGDSAVVLPQGITPNILEAMRASGGNHDVFVSKMDEAIAKIILSQTMTTDNGSSRAQAQVHEGVRNEVVKSDNDLLCDSFTDGPVRWLVEWNFPGAARPRVWRDGSDGEDLDKRSVRDKNLHDAGWSLDPEAVTRVYGPGYVPTAPAPGRAAVPAAEKRSAAFAEADPAPEDAADRLTGQVEPMAERPFDTAIGNISTLLEDSSSLAEFGERLIGLYPGLPVEELTKLMQGALATAELQGRADMADGT